MRTIIPDIPDSQTLDVLNHLATVNGAGALGVTRLGDSEYIWCDDNGTPRGCLSVWPENDGKNSFVVRVHPAWRRRGIATKLYTKASREFLLVETEFTPLGSLWIESIGDTSF